MLNLIKELMAHNGKNYLRYSTLSGNSWLIMVRIISDILNLTNELRPQYGKNYLRYSTVSRNSWLINCKNYLRYSTLSRNSWLIMVRIIRDTQPYQETHDS